MLIAAVIALCILLCVLGFLAPRLSRHPQRGVNRVLGGGRRGASHAPGRLGRWLQKPFSTTQRAANKSASAGRPRRSSPRAKVPAASWLRLLPEQLADEVAAAVVEADDLAGSSIAFLRGHSGRPFRFPSVSTIRSCRDDERTAMLAIINAAAEAYRGVIPADRWHDPYMAADELDSEIAAGVTFWGYEAAGELVG